jgi:hypothetical protein
MSNEEEDACLRTQLFAQDAVRVPTCSTGVLSSPSDVSDVIPVGVVV